MRAHRRGGHGRFARDGRTRWSAPEYGLGRRGVAPPWAGPAPQDGVGEDRQGQEQAIDPRFDLRNALLPLGGEATMTCDALLAQSYAQSCSAVPKTACPWTGHHLL